MEPRSPTLEGFRAVVRWPALGFAEIAWRWSFAAAAGLLFTFCVGEYLDTLPVTRGELFLLRTRHPVLIAQAVAQIFRGSAQRAVLAAIVLTLALTVAWIVIASLGRAALVKALLEYFRGTGAVSQPIPARLNFRHESDQKWRPGSLIGLNFFRVGVAFAGAVGYLAAVLLRRAASAGTDPSPGRGVLVVFILITFVALACSVLNWFLSLATIFVVGDGEDTFGAIAAAVDLCRTRTGSVFAAGTWFGLAHLTVFVAASCAITFPLAAAGVLPRGLVLTGVLLLTLFYFAAADFLKVGRLAAYVAIVELPDRPVAPPPPYSGRSPALGPPPSASVDPDELILSDVEDTIVTRSNDPHSSEN
jgi:hypothetical protein